MSTLSSNENQISAKSQQDVCGRAMELALNGSHQTEDKVPNICWKDWIYMESIRR